MLIRVQVKTNQRQGRLCYNGEVLLASVHAPAIDGRANRELIELMASSLGVTKSMIVIVKGATISYKTLSVELEDKKLQERLDRLDRVAQQLDLF